VEPRFWDRTWVVVLQSALNVAVAFGILSAGILVGRGVLGVWMIVVVVGVGLLCALINHASHEPDDELPPD
jgi:hypothetical protein